MHGEVPVSVRVSRLHETSLARLAQRAKSFESLRQRDDDTLRRDGGDAPKQFHARNEFVKTQRADDFLRRRGGDGLQLRARRRHRRERQVVIRQGCELLLHVFVSARDVQQRSSRLGLFGV